MRRAIRPFCCLFIGIQFFLHSTLPAQEALAEDATSRPATGTVRSFTLPADFPDQAAQKDGAVRLTLPNGQPVIGKAQTINHSNGKIHLVKGVLTYPESGTFHFERDAEGKLQGGLAFDSKLTEWKVEPSGEGRTFRMVETPVADAFRPRKTQWPSAAEGERAGLSRENADAALRKDLKIESISSNKLRIGDVELDKKSRAIRFPVSVNMASGQVEYVLVTTEGKRHESLFTTTASPRDIHLAMLLLSVKPARCESNPDGRLILPADASVDVRVEWKEGKATRSYSVSELVDLPKSPSPDGAKRAGTMWLYNGSQFSEAGFAALMEGSIISLITDETALINNAGRDHLDDENHSTASNVIPAVGTPATLIISPAVAAPTPKPKKSQP